MIFFVAAKFDLLKYREKKLNTIPLKRDTAEKISQVISLRN